MVCALWSEDAVVVSSDYESTHEGNHSDGSDAAHTEEESEEGKSSAQIVKLRPLIIPPEVRVITSWWGRGGVPAPAPAPSPRMYQVPGYI